jgi:hypothetical protein
MTSLRQICSRRSPHLGAQRLVLALHDLASDVGHPTAAGSRSSGHAVKVDPVVPVNRTRR